MGSIWKELRVKVEELEKERIDLWNHEQVIRSEYIFRAEESTLPHQMSQPPLTDQNIREDLIRKETERIRKHAEKIGVISPSAKDMFSAKIDRFEELSIQENNLLAQNNGAVTPETAPEIATLTNEILKLKHEIRFGFKIAESSIKETIERAQGK